MRLILPKKSFFIFLIVLLFSIEGFSQTYTITGNVNASSYSCSSFSGYTTISIGNGSTTTKLTMNSDLNLIGSCSLGPLRIIVNNASIDFSTANNRLTLPEGSSIEFLNGGALYPDGGNGGGCTGSDRIYIGDKNIAACQGSSGVVGFDDINDLGGTGTAYSNSPVCVGNPINLTATPPPNGTFTYSWTGPNSFTSTSQYPTFTAISSSDGVYNVVMTRTSDSKKAYGRVTVVVGASITPTLSSNDADNSFCAGTSVMFTAGGGTSYNFKVNGVSVQNGTSTTYTTSTLTNGQVVTVVVSNSSCSVTSSGITNIVNALPSAGLTSNDADNIFCSGTLEAQVFKTVLQLLIAQQL
ncbi:MAG: hypothetical protein B7Y83_07105 [Flavobacteriales bacterium 32-34-25]|nr:MAG: hypothetical protein B7Y83_07105 [Flavobacteriales bacterium 32-34-25]